MSTLTAHRTECTVGNQQARHADVTGGPAGTGRAYAETMMAAAVEDYRALLPVPQRERLLLVCKEALDSHTADVERLARDLLCALCPDVPDGVRDSLAWICGDIAARR